MRAAFLRVFSRSFTYSLLVSDNPISPSHYGFPLLSGTFHLPSDEVNSRKKLLAQFSTLSSFAR